MSETNETTSAHRSSSQPNARPFGVNFEQNVLEPDALAETNTTSMSDDDTGTYRTDTEDGDT
jgi:hypothetical protein